MNWDSFLQQIIWDQVPDFTVQVNPFNKYAAQNFITVAFVSSVILHGACQTFSFVIFIRRFCCIVMYQFSQRKCYVSSPILCQTYSFGRVNKYCCRENMCTILLFIAKMVVLNVLPACFQLHATPDMFIQTCHCSISCWLVEVILILPRKVNTFAS